MLSSGTTSASDFYRIVKILTLDSWILPTEFFYDYKNLDLHHVLGAIG